MTAKKTAKKSESEKSDFDCKKELLNLQKELEMLKHENKMKELEVQRQNTLLFHEKECERQRIKSAEIRKTMERKSDYNFMKNMGGSRRE